MLQEIQDIKDEEAGSPYNEFVLSTRNPSWDRHVVECAEPRPPPLSRRATRPFDHATTPLPSPPCCKWHHASQLYRVRLREECAAPTGCRGRVTRAVIIQWHAQ